jgi:malate dehydrogenase (oxaloacetate-decarboxylating)
MSIVGQDLRSDRYRNKGTAFSCDERDKYGLHGLIPPVVEDLGTQLQRVRVEYDATYGELAPHLFLRSLQETNSVLFSTRSTSRSPAKARLRRCVRARG